MGVGAGFYMYVVVVQKFTFAISSPDEFLFVSDVSITARRIAFKGPLSKAVIPC